MLSKPLLLPWPLGCTSSSQQVAPWHCLHSKSSELVDNGPNKRPELGPALLAECLFSQGTVISNDNVVFIGYKNASTITAHRGVSKFRISCRSEPCWCCNAHTGMKPPQPLPRLCCSFSWVHTPETANLGCFPAHSKRQETFIRDTYTLHTWKHFNEVFLPEWHCQLQKTTWIFYVKNTLDCFLQINFEDLDW